LDDNGQVEVKDFTVKVKPKRFRIDDDVFEAVKMIPLGLMKDLAGLSDVVKIASIEAGMEKITALMDLVLLPDSFEVFNRRLTDKLNPIGDEHLLPVVRWLLEQYTKRPTQPPLPSLDSSVPADASTSSTAGVLVEESTGPVLEPIGSSTSSITGPPGT